MPQVLLNRPRPGWPRSSTREKPLIPWNTMEESKAEHQHLLAKEHP